MIKAICHFYATFYQSLFLYTCSGVFVTDTTQTTTPLNVSPTELRNARATLYKPSIQVVDEKKHNNDKAQMTD